MNQPTFSDLVRETFALAVDSEFGRSLIGPGGLFEVVEEDVLGQRMAVFKNRQKSIFDLLHGATVANAERAYLADDERRLTYREHMDAVGNLARILREDYCVGPADRVGIFAANSLEWVIGFWATIATGAVVAAMNSYWSGLEAAAGLNLTTPRVVLADERRGQILDRVAPGVPVLQLNAALYDRITREPGSEPSAPEPHEDDPAVLLFTSGTTGKAKAVLHSHRAVIGINACSMFNTLLCMGAFPTEIPPPPRLLTGAPFFHLSGLYGGIIIFTAFGGLLVVRPGRFDEERTLQAIESERITHWAPLGSAGPRIASHPTLLQYDLTSVRMVSVGGAPMTPAVKSLLSEAFESAIDGMLMGYTSTESCCSLAVIRGAAFDDHPESTGPIQDGVQVRIRDEKGNDLPDGSQGLIHVRSPYTMLEFWSDPNATADVYAPGRWLNMGDVGRIENGLLYINSRARDVIFVSAENVFPSEVENRLEEHDAVVEACVAGIDDPITGHAVKAFVVLDETVAVDEFALTEWCRGGLPAYKVPTSWEFLSKPLPRNATGKVLRNQLVDATVSS
jgi:long-chain acyl-CoA synthetase